MIYICIPAHNEEQTVGVVLWKIRQVMAEFPRDYQLLVVDDASTDKTPEVLAPYARVLPLTVVRNEARRGEGAALEMMLREAVRRSQYPKRDVIITLQADFTQEPDELVGLIKRTEAGADIVVGETTSDPKAPASLRWARALALRVLGRRRIPQGIKDPFTSYRAYRVQAVKRALEERGGRIVHWNGWAGAAELLLATAPHARRIDGVPMTERRERLQRETRLAPWAALKAVWSLAREARPLEVQTPAELDQAMQSIAAVRTSEVAAARTGARPTQRRDVRRGNTEERGRGRERPERENRPRRPEREEPPTEARRRRERKPEEGRAKRPDRPERGERQATPRPPKPESAVTPPVAAEPVALEAQLPLDPLLAAIEGATSLTPEAAARKRRKRPRRRKRANGNGGNGEPAATADELQMEGFETALVAGEAAGSDEEGGAPVSEEEGAQRARRRRRGRRGGRRRSGGGVAGEAAGAAEAGAGAEAPNVEAPPQPMKLLAPPPVPVAMEGERSSDS